MLRQLRIICALIFLLGLTALFLDFTGVTHHYLGWMAQIQFLPSLLALNTIIIISIALITLIFGRIYCSVVCPLGVMQDVFAWFGKRGKKLPYKFEPAHNYLRYGVLLLFIIASAAGIGSILALLAPYSSFGRIAVSVLQPLYLWGNNLLAYFAERADSYAFYEKQVWLRSTSTLLIATTTLGALGYLSWKHGRTYCNSICPVGTVLGLISRFSLLRMRINKNTCKRCTLCARKCKSKCIDSKNHRIDFSRCVVCMDCIGNCKEKSITYGFFFMGNKNEAAPKVTKPKVAKKPNEERRSFLSWAAMLATASLAKQAEGGLAPLIKKKAPQRKTPVLPPGAQSASKFARNCTGCQLCVSACPNDVLRPAGGLLTSMQAEMSYEHGFCRPECNRCAERCPAGAILPMSEDDKLETQIGHAVLTLENCISAKGEACGHCARVCPVGAIDFIPLDEENPESPEIPMVDQARCIGCGACEHYCPARPLSAIHVEGHLTHTKTT